MTTYSFPAVTPNSMTLELISNTATFQSWNGAIQTTDRGGERWAIVMTFTNLRGDDRAILQAFIARLNGQQHRFRVKNFAAKNRGNLGGAPLVNGSGQTGKSIIVDGAAASQSPWIAAGDWVSVNSELKMCVADANSDGSGAVTFEFVPRLRVAAPNNSAIGVSGATGKFVMTNTPVFAESPGGFFSTQIEAIEDIT